METETACRDSWSRRTVAARTVAAPVAAPVVRGAPSATRRTLQSVLIIGGWRSRPALSPMSDVDGLVSARAIGRC
ncbi:hypothetical protein, partial [Cryobacterium mannosilyticum]|uniref:hypothetical protein n=1 Tax=Cryobacterium mannosilyticum TaxID=1259190 RepID=UPI001A7E796E